MQVVCPKSQAAGCCLPQTRGLPSLPDAVAALQEPCRCLQTEGYLPQANVAFIDEVFKANSAILNTLLTVLNERLFDNGAVRETVPLLCLVRLGAFAEAAINAPD